jgi:hypothetical protein
LGFLSVEKHFHHKEHCRIYGLDYHKRLKKAGFQTEIVDYIQEFNPSQIQKYSLDIEEKIYLCSK